MNDVSERGVPILPSPDRWNAAVQHSIDNPEHILGPYSDADDIVQMDCVGTDPNDPNCDFDTANLTTEASNER
jgi:hypothetical protein